MTTSTPRSSDKTAAAPAGLAGPGLGRRSMLRSAALGGLAVPVLAACGDDAAESVDPTTPASTPTTPASSDGAEVPSTALVAAADVPVGGGVVVKDANVVVTQPNQGEFKAFTAVCTHSGCQVGSVSDGKIVCPCHGSAFSIEDGSVVNGPAQAPLGSIGVSAQDGQIVEG